MIVQAMDAFKSPCEAEWSIRADTRVPAYIAKRRRAPMNARIRFVLCGFLFFMRIILYILVRL